MPAQALHLHMIILFCTALAASPFGLLVAQLGRNSIAFWDILAFVARFNSSEVYSYAVLEDLFILRLQ